MMRVGLGTSMIEPARTGGRLDGIGVYTEALLQHLGAAGCELTAWSYPPLRSRRGAVDVGRAMPRSFEAAMLADLLTPRARRMRMGADIFHVTDYRIARMDCPVVATLHDALPIKYPQWCNPRLRRAKNWMQKKAARKADHVIALSRFAVDELVECFGVDPRRISVVPCGVGEHWLQPCAPEAVAATLAAYGLRPGYFLTVGTLQPRKNIGRLLDAWLGLPSEVRAQRQLVVVGAPGWRSAGLVDRLRAARQNGHDVRWLHRVAAPETLRQLYAGAGVFVFPSLYEGFGIPLVEAFASGVPVVASNTTSLPEVTRGAAFDIDPLDSRMIGAAMLALATDDHLRERCIEAGRERAAQLTWRATAEQTAAVYRAVLAG
ncbi:MAG: glycosyltransferase family 1 protein [Pseudomonadota bacterium]